MHTSKYRHAIATIVGFIAGLALPLFPQRQYVSGPNSTDFGIVVFFAVVFWGPVGALLTNAVAEALYNRGKVQKISIAILIIAVLLVGYAHRPWRKVEHYCNGISLSEWQTPVPDYCKK